MKKYLLPIALGFAGMLVAHIIILSGFGLGLKFPLYFVASPGVYSLIVFFLTGSNTKFWFTNAIFICVIPFIYWYLLMWDDGKLHWSNAIKFTNSSGMLIIMPFTFLVAILVSLLVYKFKKPVTQVI